MFDRIAFGALIRRKRGERGLTQQQLAVKVFGDENRKGDISRIENGKTAPQEDTVQKLCEHLDISEAEMAPIRTGGASAKQLDHIPALSREQLENLAARFEIERAYDLSDPALRDLLTKKAEEYRAYRAEIDAIDERTKGLGNLKAAAQDAAERLDFEEVETLLSRVHEVEKEIAAETGELRAQNALLRGKVEQAYKLYCDAADSFSVVDSSERTRRRLYVYSEALWRHTLRYGGDGFRFVLAMVDGIESDVSVDKQSKRFRDFQIWRGLALQDQGIRTAGPKGAELLSRAVTAYENALTIRGKAEHPVDWAMTQNNLGNALSQQGLRTDGPEGAELLSHAVTAYESALTIYSKAEHPVQWATTQNNLGAALRNQGIRTAGPKGAELLFRAVTAFENALTIRSKAERPVDWAMTQNNLGIALQNQGTRTDGPEGAELLALAVTAYEHTLTIFSKAEHPVDWAMTQESIAFAEQALASHDAVSDPRPHIEAALAHVEAALTVYDPEHMSYRHDNATTLRDRIRAALEALDD